MSEADPVSTVEPEQLVVTSVNETTLSVALADAITAVPGVVRLEPTLDTAGLRGIYRRHAADGIRLVLHADVVDVDVNVAVDRGHQARTVAHRIRHLIRAEVASRSIGLGSATVSVLTIE